MIDSDFPAYGDRVDFWALVTVPQLPMWSTFSLTPSELSRLKQARADYEDIQRSLAIWDQSAAWADSQMLKFKHFSKQVNPFPPGRHEARGWKANPIVPDHPPTWL